jgi:hypothetical protein
MPLPQFFVSVASKGFSFPVSPLKSTLVGILASVDSRGVIRGSSQSAIPTRTSLFKLGKSPGSEENSELRESRLRPQSEKQKSGSELPLSRP